MKFNKIIQKKNKFRFGYIKNYIFFEYAYLIISKSMIFNLFREKTFFLKKNLLFVYYINKNTWKIFCFNP